MMTGREDNGLREPISPGEALGQSDAFLDFQERLSRAAPVERPVLIVGERGTGKELAARRLHFLSQRWREPFVELNCAALAPTLLESELFGHEAGAFTGAVGQRRGRFEAANGGTLFLDELGNLPIPVQQKILRVVEYGRFERVGGARSIQVDVRIIGATHADLPTLAAAGRFMPDLLDRLSFEVLYAPPLRARHEDIMLLAQHFAGRMTFDLGRDTLPEFSSAAVSKLTSHPWPGNIRELKNVVERAVYRADGPHIDTIDFDPFASPWRTLAPTAVPPAPQPETVESPEVPPTAPSTASQPTPAVSLSRPLKTQVEALEKALVDTALEESHYNQREAAQRLGLTYHQFRGLYRKYTVGQEKAL